MTNDSQRLLKKKVLFVGLGALLAATLSAAVSFAVAPAALGVEHVLCPSGMVFTKHVGATEYLPDGQPVGSLSMVCEDAAGNPHDANLMGAALTHFGAWFVLWAALLAWAVRALLASAHRRPA